MQLRPYQETVLDDLWAWFHRHPDGNPVVVAAVGAGKSLMISAVAKRMHEQCPGARVLVLMHQKELLEQNVDKMSRIWPEANVGVFSASKGRKDLGCQITFATIGSVWKQAHRLGRIDMVMADECHLINTKQQGMWRSFLTELERYCPGARVVGWTGTDFRGNGVYLTDGKEALFTHAAAKITMRQLLDLGFLAPLTPAVTTARVSAADVPTSGDDYVVHELAKITDTEELVEATVSEIHALFSDRKRWLVFAVTIAHAQHVADALRRRGVSVDIVSAETPKAEREEMIARFRDGRLRCLVNVAVLTTGFDVPELDAIALLRATKSPVLYVQIAGRGMRLAEGKTDCLWADFTDTTSRLGPVDEIKGRPATSRGSGEAPFKICPECGSRNTAAATECLDCGHQFPKPELIKHGATARGAAVLSNQANPERDIDVTRVTYGVHVKHGSEDSMRVDYWSGIEVVCREWVCFDHTGYARLKAESWWNQRKNHPTGAIPRSSADAVVAADGGAVRAPHGITINTREKYPKPLAFRWAPREEARAA